MSKNNHELGRIFKTSLYGLAMFASLILGMAEENWLPYITLAMAVIGFWVTESNSGFFIGNWLSNLAGLVAVGMSGVEFFSDNPEGRLLAGTHLVVYAAWIVFLQQGTVRKYWSICALSVLQVAVASVLTNDSWYGIALIAFSVAAMWTLAVFSLYQVTHQYATPALATAGTGRGQFQFSAAVSHVDHSVQFDGVARWITWRFVSGVAVLALLALVMSAVFYVLTPRVWLGHKMSLSESAEEPELGRRTITGFSQQVKLGELGSILESMEPVMSIQAYDVRSGEDRKLSAEELAAALGYDEPLFRGGIMTSYFNGSWEADEINETPERLPRTPAHTDVRQEVSQELVAGDILFCFGTAVACDFGGEHTRQRANFHWLSGVLHCSRMLAESRRTLNYRLYAEAAQRSADQIPRIEIRTSLPMGTPGRDQSAVDAYLHRCRALPAGSLTRLIELAQSIEQRETELRGRRPTNAELAQRMETYLRDSGEFDYTLKLSIQDAAIDPVEDFLFNRKTGHCEYFASALALMLRAVGIPSRLMNGFKGGENNYLGQIEVQQRHAHAWVEAWDGEGRWMVLDPTPAGARAESVKDVGAGLPLAIRVQAFFATFWNDWVMNFTPDRQREGLFMPIKDFGQKLFAQGKDVAGRNPFGLATLWKFLTNPREWFSWKGLLFLISVAVIGYAIRLGFRLLRRWVTWKRLGTHAAFLQLQTVPFYERFVQLMGDRGLLRTEDQTPAEFAAEVTQLLESALPDRTAPHWITSFFYQVRFGEVGLTPAETETVNLALQQLEQGGSAQT